MTILNTKYEGEYNLSQIPNPTFQELREDKNQKDIEEISEKIRIKLLEKWEKFKQPLGGGRKTDEKIISDFKNLILYNDNQTLIFDTDDNKNCLKFFSKLTSGINQYFPEMLDTPIGLGNKSASVMDVIKSKDVFLKFFFSVVVNDRMYSFTMWYDDSRIPIETRNLLSEKIIVPLTSGFKLPFFYKKENLYYKLNKDTIRYNICSQKEYDGNSKIFPQITQSFRLGGGSQPVSNFSAGIARFLIRNNFMKCLENGIDKNVFICLDTSTGWGGRLVGLLSLYSEMRKLYFEKTSKQLKVVYLTTDPNIEINDRYDDIINDWFSVIEPEAEKKHFKMFKSLDGSETPEFLNFCKDFFNKMGVNGCNMGLTSPPYFNREQ